MQQTQSNLKAETLVAYIHGHCCAAWIASDGGLIVESEYYNTESVGYTCIPATWSVVRAFLGY
jgi:hypothetical protein